MNTHVVIQGTLEPDGSLVLDQKPNLTPGRVRVMVENINEPPRPDRFWAMMEQIGDESKTSGYVPRSVEEIEAERHAFREEWDECQGALERIHLDGERLHEQTNQPREQLR